MNDRIVTVFGGTGFLGRHVVRCLRANGFAVRVASRHPDRAEHGDPKIQAIRADIRDPISVEAALVNAWGVVNAVSLYVERGTRHVPRDPRQRGAHHCAERAGGRGRTADPGVRHRRRHRLALALCAQARRRRARGAVGVSRRGDRAPGGDVRHRRRLRHHRARSHAQAAGLSDVRARADAAAAGRGRRRGGSDRAHPRSARSASRRSTNSAGRMSSPTKISCAPSRARRGCGRCWSRSRSAPGTCWRASRKSCRARR